YHNKAVGYVREILHQYVSYFSPELLLSRGGKPARYLVPDHGVMFYTFLAELVLAVTGTLFALPWGKENKVLAKDGDLLWRALLWMMLVAPLASALTLDDVP